MSYCVVAVSSEAVSQRMLGVEVRRLCRSTELSATVRSSAKLRGIPAKRVQKVPDH